MTKREVQIVGGSPLFSLLAVLFIGLKLTGYITWSWWWVLSPLWIPLAIFIVGFLTVFVAAILFGVISKH